MAAQSPMSVRDLMKRLIECDPDKLVKFYTAPEAPLEPEEGIVMNDDTTSDIVDVKELDENVLIGCEDLD